MRPLTAAVAATGIPTASGVLGVPAGLPWPAAFALVALGLLIGAFLAWTTERHRHTEFLTTVGKAAAVERFDVNDALRQCSPPPTRSRRKRTDPGGGGGVG